jgi:hypothetical protein
MSGILREFDPVWSESGDTGTPPDDTKIETGWVGGERAKMERLNYLQGRVEDRLNDIVREGVKGYSDHITTDEAKLAIATGLYAGDDWGNIRNTANNMYGGAATKAYTDLCVAFDPQTHDQILLVLDDTNKTIDVFDPRVGTLTTTSSALTDDLPSPTGTWHVYSMCTDGESVYVFCTDTHGGADTHRVQAWNISSWDVKSGWSSTGTALSGSGTRSTTDGKDILIVSSTHLAVAESWTASVAATPATKCIELLTLAAGTIPAGASGAGQGDLGATGYNVKTMASDGVAILFIADDGTNVILGTATLADLTAGTGGTGYPLSLGTDTDTKIIACGYLFITANGFSVPGFAATDIVLRAHTRSDATRDTIERGRNSASSAKVGDKWIFEHATDLTYDGLNLWITAQVNNATTDGVALVKIDIAKIWESDTDEVKQINDITNSIFATPIEPASYTPTTFDGRDIWFITNQAASGTLSGYVYRLPMALIRH